MLLLNTCVKCGALQNRHSHFHCGKKLIHFDFIMLCNLRFTGYFEHVLGTNDNKVVVVFKTNGMIDEFCKLKTC